ncbi:hypothetical protein MGG_17149 [Pyricularia oryzae 70-15]|uniref:Uncharacterized protein n=1 Tax=Pyricularia oryzae (strain 70-15 / ATCC MYA-4617 / FGSC 8958) TaxID=242507 RepID=G4N617_PYRO7|nr:uncharacterized protein MGG_17149 [Pyricularia oryzae 70-15]EHA50593.1 hypothetical protein MGG_17149 [Pyricularia oryzae 70-15]
MLGRVGTFLPPQPKGFNSKTGLAGGKYGLPAQVAVCFLMHDNSSWNVPSLLADARVYRTCQMTGPRTQKRTIEPRMPPATLVDRIDTRPGLHFFFIDCAIASWILPNHTLQQLCFLGKPIGAC